MTTSAVPWMMATLAEEAIHAPCLKGLHMHNCMTVGLASSLGGIPSGATSDSKIPEIPWLESALEAEQGDGSILLDGEGVRIRVTCILCAQCLMWGCVCITVMGRDCLEVGRESPRKEVMF